MGGTKAQVSGIGSTNYLDGIIPSATITVYLTGTTTKATIYADKLSTPLANPFTSNTAGSVNPGGWIFWAATNQGLDVVMSGGIAPNTYATPVTLVDIFPSSQFISPSGGCGSVSGDNSSTNCGFQNRTGDTATIPAHVQTFGSQLLASNQGTDVVAIGQNTAASAVMNRMVVIGDGNANNSSGSDFVDIGMTNGAFVFPFGGTISGDTYGASTVQIGFGNLIGTDANLNGCYPGSTVVLGNANLAACKGQNLLGVNIIGESNFFNTPSPNTQSISRSNIFGNYNLTGLGTAAQILDATLIGTHIADFTTGLSDVIAMGYKPLNAGFAATRSYQHIIALGEFNGQGLLDGSSENVLIGDGVGDVNGAAQPLKDAVLIGDLAGEANTANDIIGIGDEVLGQTGVSKNVGNDLIAIGNHALMCNQTGNDNIGIGDFAGSIGWVGPPSQSCGNSNTSGSHNVWIGDTAGPNTTSQLSNTIAIGYQAHNTASNQAVIGSSTITQTLTFGVTVNGTLFSAAGTALPSCVSGLKGATGIVSDATGPTYLATYSSGGTVVSPVMCNGTNWVTY